MDTTAHDIRILSIGYYIQGGLTLGFGLLFGIYACFIGLVIAIAQANPQAEQTNQLPAGFIHILVAVFIGVAILTLAFGALMLYGGSELRKYQHRTLILVLAALNCFMFPYGTVLGVFTFIVLQRNSAKELFNPSPAPPIPPADPAPSI
jgi:hypothetical protein